MASAAPNLKHGLLGEFRAGVQSIDKYKERFELYYLANAVPIGDEHVARRKAIFLTSVGASTYSLLRTLERPRQPQDLELDDIIQQLRNHYEPKKIVIAERFRYYKTQQKEGETVTMFLSELLRVAKHCEFGDKLSVALRDQFVCGLRAEALQQKILAETDLTLDKAVRIAQAFESARQETIALRGDTRRHGSTTDHETAFSMQSSSSGRSKTTQSDVKVCYRCNGKGHVPDKCQMKSRECYLCHKKGHIAKACRSNGLGSQDAIKINMTVAGRELELIVDTGTTITVIPRETYEKQLSHVKLQSSNVKLQSYCGQTLSVRGEAVVPVRYGDQEIRGRVVVVNAANKPTVLGRNWLSQLKVDWASLLRLNVLDPVHEFPELFKEGMGKLQGVQGKITLSANARPVFHKARAVPFALQAKVDTEIDR